MANEIIHKFTCTGSIINESSAETRDVQVQSVAIKRKFFNNAYPLYVVDLYISNDDRDYIVSNNVFLHLETLRYDAEAVDPSTAEETSSTPTYTETTFIKNLNIYDKELIHSHPSSTDTTNDSDNTVENVNEQKVHYTLYCIPKDDVEKNNSIINFSLENANVNEAAIHAITSVYSGDLYYQESKNAKRYESLFVPPQSLIQTLKFINEKYGFYNNSRINLFWDFNKVYLCDLMDNSKTFNRNVFINIIPNETNSNKNVYGIPLKTDNENDIEFYLSREPGVISNRDVFMNTIGGQTIFNSYDDDYNLVTRDYSNTDIDNKVRFSWNGNKNQIFEQQALRNPYQIVSLEIKNYDPGYLSPDTKFSLNGATIDNINGEYFLLEADSFFSTSDYTNYNNTNILSLAKY